MRTSFIPVIALALCAARPQPGLALSDQVKITLVQLTTKGQSPESVIERMPAFFDAAAEQGSDLIVFPEAWGCTSFNGAEVILWINGREGMIEDGYCIFAADAYGCAVGANITDGKNTGVAGRFVRAPGAREESLLFPRIPEPGNGAVHATIDLAGLRRSRKHLRTMHQRRPELYGRLTEDVKIWQDYPDIPWDFPECPGLVNQPQLPPP